MEALEGIVTAVGYVVMFVGGILILIKAFQKSLLWCFLSLLLPGAILVFIITNFDVAKKPFFVWLGGFVLFLIGVVALGVTGEMEDPSTPSTMTPPAMTDPQ